MQWFYGKISPRCSIRHPKIWNFCHLGYFAETWTCGFSNRQYLVEHIVWDDTSRRSWINFCLLPKGRCGLALSWWKATPTFMANYELFSLIAAFNLSDSDQCPIFVYLGGAKSTEFPFSLTRYKRKLSKRGGSCSFPQPQCRIGFSERIG